MQWRPDRSSRCMRRHFQPRSIGVFSWSSQLRLRQNHIPCHVGCRFGFEVPISQSVFFPPCCPAFVPIYAHSYREVQSSHHVFSLTEIHQLTRFWAPPGTPQSKCTISLADLSLLKTQPHPARSPLRPPVMLHEVGKRAVELFLELRVRDDEVILVVSASQPNTLARSCI